MPYIYSLLIAIILILSSCQQGSSTIGGGNPLPTPPGGTVVDPPEPGEEETVVIGAPGLCNSGDIARVSVSSAGSARFALVSDDYPCTPAKDNRLEEYSMILFNTTESPIAFRVDSPSAVNPFAFSSSNHNSSYDFDKPVTLNMEPQSYNTGALDTSLQAANLPIAGQKNQFGPGQNVNALVAEYVLGDEVEVRVLNDPSNFDSTITSSAILRAQGTFINLFVDRDIPMGGIHDDSPEQQDLDHAVEIFDRNIYPLVTTLLGEPSDVDENGRINVLITPIINAYIKASTYVDARNVAEYNPISNAVSNEGEFIFIQAPDSLANYTSTGNGITVDTYFKNKLFNAWMAFQLPKIISFNQKVIINGGAPENDWIDDGIGAVMADLCGFNLFREASWRYLAAPQLDDLRKADFFEIVAGQGAEYLFMLYYVQSNLDNTLQDVNTNGFDDDLEFLSEVYAASSVGPQNLVQHVDVLYDADIESEFDGLFKDFIIALLTSGSGQTALQQGGQTALSYYQNYNPLIYGSEVNDANGSVRAGADGVSVSINDGQPLDGDASQNLIGLDLHNYNIEDRILFENVDEYVYAPGNAMNGYIDPYSAMFVRMSGLLMSEQSIGLFSSSTSLRGFLVRRPDLSYPKTYHESIFGAINQMFEDLDEIGPNPFWENQGPIENAKRINLAGMIASNPLVGETSEDFVSIVGEIDPSQSVYVCPELLEDCSFEAVQDTDKYVFTVPDLGRGDEGELSISIRRRFDEGVDSSAFNPLLAIVSSKDVPYPYVPHPIRNTVNDDLGGTDTRQQYRWLTSQLICGDDQDSLGDATLAATNIGIDCVPGDEEDSLKIITPEDTLIENTGSLNTTMGAWDGDIVGGECDFLPVVDGVNSLGYGDYSAYPVTTMEVSGSSLGQYPWSNSFMQVSYNGSPYPKVLFDREFLKVSAEYPSLGDETNPPYDPRAVNGLNLNCHIQTGGDLDLTPDSPDDFLSYEDMQSVEVSTLSHQILTEMSRNRFSSSGLAESTVLDPKYDSPDVFVTDGDSRDEDLNCSTVDMTHNMNTYTVRGGGEGAILMAEDNKIIPHIAFNFNGSASGFSGQSIYDNDGGETKLKLVPGKSYTLIVGGEGDSTGDYEIRIRKVSTTNKNFAKLKDFDDDETCFFEL
ncbi:MAG TPA: hypothetical protein PKC21_01050 [Oligoflexia bacterium]|nr:hypothetical protein [Oligoflexia bacterium]HMR23916.1 hypothetical protein [Oligoflexia bacterium]